MTTVGDKHVHHFGAVMLFLLDKSWSFIDFPTNTKVTCGACSYSELICGELAYHLQYSTPE